MPAFTRAPHQRLRHEPYRRRSFKEAGAVPARVGHGLPARLTGVLRSRHGHGAPLRPIRWSDGPTAPIRLQPFRESGTWPPGRAAKEPWFPLAMVSGAPQAQGLTARIAFRCNARDSTSMPVPGAG